MTERSDRAVPEPVFLDSVERLFSARYPSEFRLLCRTGGGTMSASLLTAGVKFICDLDSLRAVNSEIGEGEWGDLETALSVSRHPRDGNRLWGGILPFAARGDCVFGFDAGQPGSDRVLVWSVHTVVHAYLSFQSFCAALGVFG